MANLKGLIPAFTIRGLKGYLEDKSEQYEQNVLDSLLFMGEEFVNQARNIRTYQDQTGNLRSSIGYIVLKNGEEVVSNFAAGPRGSDRRSGVKRGREFAEKLKADYPRGYVLIGVAGMEYAAAVESKGYDVITGSAPSDGTLASLIRDIFSDNS